MHFSAADWEVHATGDIAAEVIPDNSDMIMHIASQATPGVYLNFLTKNISIEDGEVRADIESAAGTSAALVPQLLFRVSDAVETNEYYFVYNPGVGKWEAWRKVGVVRTKICEAGFGYQPPLTWLKYRARVWTHDAPPDSVRLTLDVWVDEAWLNILDCVDTSPGPLSGASGKCGFGGTNIWGNTAWIHYDDVVIGEKF